MFVVYHELLIPIPEINFPFVNLRNGGPTTYFYVHLGLSPCSPCGESISGMGLKKWAVIFRKWYYD